MSESPERPSSLETERALRAEAEKLIAVARVFAAERDLTILVQKVTDTGTDLTGAKFGAFFYNVVNEQGESLLLYTLSGAPREAFEKFGAPRNTELFGPTFRGEGTIRVDDVHADPRYGKSPPHRGMPAGHLPVRSYLSVPVRSHDGEVIGGLFFGHPEPGIFTERSAHLAEGIAAQAGIAIDNAQLYERLRQELDQRKQHENDALFLTELEGRLGPLLDPDRIIRVASRLVGEYLGAHRCYFCEWSPTTDTVEVRDDWRSAGALALAGIYDMNDFGPPEWIEEMRAGHVTIANVETQSLAQNYLTSYRAIEVVAYATSRLIQSRSSQITLAVTMNRPRIWRAGEMTLLENVASRVWGRVERARAEMAGQENAERLRLALEAGRIGDWRWDATTDKIALSERAAAILGVAPATEITATMMRDLVVEKEQFEAHWAADPTAGAAENYEIEFQILRPDGESRWVALRGRSTRAADGTATGTRGVLHDITERKTAEVKLQRRNELLSLLSESAHDLLAATDPDLMVEQLFDKVSRRLDLDVFFNFMVDRPGETLRLDVCGGINEETREAFANLNYGDAVCGLVAKEGRKIIVSDVQNCGFPPANGVRSMGVRVYACHPLLAGDRLIGTLSFGSRVRDHFESDELEFMQTITSYVAMAKERLRIERERQEALQREQAASAAKDRFLAMLSHELRTPLTPVLMAVAAMEENPGLSPQMRSDLSMIRRNIELETKLIDDLLDLSRITSGKLQLRPQAVELNDAVRSVAAICGPQFLEKGVHLWVDYDPKVGQVTADPARLQQVLWNVVKNAVKFTPEGGRVHVGTSMAADGSFCVEVRDTGIGIPEAILPRIFDAFEQGDARITRQFGGLGLGLAISKVLVDLHHGSLVVASAGQGRGTTFTIGLPPRRSRVHENTAPEGKPAPRPVAQQLRLLVAEDHVDTARTLTRILTARGYKVKAAGSVAEALALAAQEPFDVLLSDIGLPDASGYDLMQQIRAHSVTKGVAMSGYGMEEDLLKSREAGFSAHLIKPVDINQLEQAIQRAASGEAGWEATAPSPTDEMTSDYLTSRP